MALRVFEESSENGVSVLFVHPTSNVSNTPYKIVIDVERIRKVSGNKLWEMLNLGT